MSRTPKTLRPDQSAAIAKLREAIQEGERRIVMAAPTGMGKTVIAAEMVQRARAKDKRVLMTVPALSLVDQTVEVLATQGVRDVGVMQASHMMTDYSQPVQVASVQTLMRRELPRADLVLVDECHKWFKFYEKWFCDPAWQQVPIIGLSATPWTRGLGAYYNRLVLASTIGDLIEQGTLSKFRVFAPAHPDLKGVRTVAGDYHEGDLYEAMKPAKLVADIVQSWQQLAQDRPTVCFAVNRAHAEQIAKQFEASGIPAGYMDCDTSQLDRSAIRGRMLRGEIKVVCNVDVIGLGVDWPEIACIVYARPTRSEMRYVQNIGRGLRAVDGKADLIVIDHSDTTLRLGFVTDIVHDELNDGKTAVAAKKEMALPKECPQCHYLKPPRTAVCPSCDHEAKHHAKPVVNAPGHLQELNGSPRKPTAAAAQFPDKNRTYGKLLWYCRQRQYKDGWAANKYRELYGVWPRGLDYMQHYSSPDMALYSWIKSTQIRYAKGIAKREAKPEPSYVPQYVPGTLCTEDDMADPL